VNTPQPDRDQSIDRLLRRSLGGRAGTVATDRCLGAEVLAAWVDGALSAADRSAAEAHASSCARCQAMVATLVRLSPPRERAAPWWRRRWFIAGLVPLTAGAAAIAIWIASPREAMRVAPAAEQVAVQPLSPAQPQADRRAGQPAPASPPAAREERPSLADRFDKPAAGRQRAPAPPPAGRQDANDARRRDEQTTTSLSAPPPPAAPSPRPLNETVEVLSREAVVVEIASSDTAVRWRIGASGMVQRSSDAGANWEMLPTGATEQLTAAASPSPTVCWVVGRAGTVLLSTDGRRFRRTAFPERADLAAVQATDGRAATVTTADGRTFRTADGGQTWIPLQEF
jgi:hypothetical protein